MDTTPPILDYAAATRTELSVLVVKSLLIAFRQRYGQEALTHALAGLPVGQDYLEDRRNWLSFDLLVELLQRFATASTDARFIRDAGRLTVSEETLGLTYAVMRSVGTPRLLYRFLFGNAHLYNRVGHFEVLALGDTHAELRYVPKRPEWNDHPLILEHRLGQFEAMPAVFGLPVADVDVHHENRDGCAAVHYRLRWLPRQRSDWLDWRLWLLVLAVSGIGVALQDALAFLRLPLPALLGLLTLMVGAAFLRQRREGQNGQHLVNLLEDTLERARQRHDELRTANLVLENLHRVLEERVEAQDVELQRRYDALQAAYAALEQVASRDGLTGLLTRRAGDEALAGYVEAHRSSGQPLSLLLFDVDHFKRVNDTYGHAGGDDVLRAIGAALAERFPSPVLSARYGGEEFVVLFPDTASDVALASAQALAQSLRQTHPVAGAPEYAVRISGGLVTLAAGDRDGAALLQRADTLLYAAKHRGRDQILAQPREPARGPTPPWTQAS